MDLKHETTTVWHRGKPRTFRELDKAEDWLKEIKMAKEEKREPKPNHLMPGETPELKRPNAAYKEDQDAQREAERTGAHSVPVKDLDDRTTPEPPVAHAPLLADIPIPESCKDCEVGVEANNTGGFLVRHRSRGGNFITGSFKPDEVYKVDLWLAETHKQENSPGTA